MPLIDTIKTLCNRLSASAGWKDLFAKHGLMIDAPGLAAEMNKALTIHREILGFEDFAEDGVRGIEPGSPSRSLFYHALASPNVLNAPDGTPLDLFPTPAELDAVENFIFGFAPPSIADLQARFPGKPLAVVLFACEYRPASQTTHRRHADMTFSRTGVARVGTRSPRYVPEFRGFFPEIPSDPFGIAVSPARYVAYLAVQLAGGSANFGPMSPQAGDTGRNFWVPVHKLFPVPECLRGLDITVAFSATHANEKILRAQRMLGLTPPATPPFRVTTGLADLSTDPNHGPGWLVPTAQPHLVQEAKTPSGNDVTFPVPSVAGNWASVDLWAITGTQAGPEYLHARTEVLPDGGRNDLNQSNTPPVDQRVSNGGYNALHYVDFTADGAIGVSCPEVQGTGGVAAHARPAYSLVSAPDFFPSCDQRSLNEWYRSNAVPIKLRKQIWSSNPPTPLSDQRFPANLQLPGGAFDPAEDTMSAIVALPLAPSTSPKPDAPEARRHAHLPDDAAGVFFPGWDASLDTKGGVQHLAAYGLGSPFPEDSKLCAALSTFWPAVAPDVTRTMDPAMNANLSGTVAPMTDAEIGRIGGLPWDGVEGPIETVSGGQPIAEYNSFVNADYVRTALANKFTMRLTSKIDFKEYTDRVLAMAYGYLALGVERTSGAQNPALAKLKEERKRWIVLSFTSLPAGTPERTQAGLDTGTSPTGSVYRASVYKAATPIVPADFRRRQIPITGRIELIVAPDDKLVLVKTPTESKWRQGVVSFV
jgi:hypothetical protein